MIVFICSICTFKSTHCVYRLYEWESLFSGFYNLEELYTQRRLLLIYRQLCENYKKKKNVSAAGKLFRERYHLWLLWAQEWISKHTYVCVTLHRNDMCICSNFVLKWIQSTYMHAVVLGRNDFYRNISKKVISHWEVQIKCYGVENWDSLCSAPHRRGGIWVGFI